MVVTEQRKRYQNMINERRKLDPVKLSQALNIAESWAHEEAMLRDQAESTKNDYWAMDRELEQAKKTIADLKRENQQLYNEAARCAHKHANCNPSPHGMGR